MSSILNRVVLLHAYLANGELEASTGCLLKADWLLCSAHGIEGATKIKIIFEAKDDISLEDKVAVGAEAGRLRPSHLISWARMEGIVKDYTKDNPLTDWALVPLDVEAGSAAEYAIHKILGIGAIQSYLAKQVSGFSCEAGGYPGGRVREDQDVYHPIEGKFHSTGPSGFLTFEASSGPSVPKYWSGFSGTPVFKDSHLIGIVHARAGSFSNNLDVISLSTLLGQEQFRTQWEKMFEFTLSRSTRTRLERWLRDEQHRNAVRNWLVIEKQADVTVDNVVDVWRQNPIIDTLREVEYRFMYVLLKDKGRESATSGAENLLYELIPLHPDTPVTYSQLGIDAQEAKRLDAQVDLEVTRRELKANRAIIFESDAPGARLTAMDSKELARAFFMNILQVRQLISEQSRPEDEEREIAFLQEDLRKTVEDYDKNRKSLESKPWLAENIEPPPIKRPNWFGVLEDLCGSETMEKLQGHPELLGIGKVYPYKKSLRCPIEEAIQRTLYKIRKELPSENS